MNDRCTPTDLGSGPMCVSKKYISMPTPNLYRKLENMKLNSNFQKEERGSNQKLLCWNG